MCPATNEMVISRISEFPYLDHNVSYVSHSVGKTKVRYSTTVSITLWEDSYNVVYRDYKNGVGYNFVYLTL